MIIKQIPPSLIGGKIYFADDEGNIRNAQGRKRKPGFSPAMQRHKGGSCYPVMSIAGKKRNIHILVCAAFWGIRQPGQECHHLDGNKFNNRPDNLIWLFPDEHKRFDRLVKKGIIYTHKNPFDAAAEPCKYWDPFCERE